MKRILAIFFFGFCAHVCAQNGSASAATAPTDTPAPAAASAAPADSVPAPVVPKEDKRIYGVLPNYRTADGSVPYSPLTAKQKFMIGFKDSVDGPSYALAAAFSGLYQLQNQNPSFGQGMKGYAQRYGYSLIDQDFGNMMTESFLPMLLKEDPRYFRKGSGRKWGRVGYAVTRIVIAKDDHGHNVFNTSEWLGNAAVGALGNAYYPDSRSAMDTLSRTLTQVGTDTISNVLKEFWPDVKRFYKRHHSHSQDPE